MPTDRYDIGMARGMRITDSPTVEEMAAHLGVSPKYYTFRYLVTMREAQRELQCERVHLQILCDYGRLRFHVNKNGTVYFHPKNYNELVADVRSRKCTVRGIVDRAMLDHSDHLALRYHAQQIIRIASGSKSVPEWVRDDASKLRTWTDTHYDYWKSTEAKP